MPGMSGFGGQVWGFGVKVEENKKWVWFKLIYHQNSPKLDDRWYSTENGEFNG